MTEQSAQKQTFTHIVQVPPNTDVQEMLGGYRSLFGIQGVVGNVLDTFPINAQGFTHPIPECNKILTDEFLHTMQLVQAAILEHGTVYLENATINGKTVVFIFYYME